MGTDERNTYDSTERRRKRERRQRLPWISYQHWFGGGRGSGRRNQDNSHYVDYYESKLLYIAIAILALSILDAALTLKLISMGATEANTFLRMMLKDGVFAFTATKLGATAVGLVLLVMHKNFKYLRVIPVYVVLNVILCAYLALVCYEVFLLVYMAT